jgi:hypothetical protein
MQISKRIYAKRNGPMVFWRLGAIGGSFYYSRNQASAEANAAKRIAHYNNMDKLRASVIEARVWKRRAAMAHGLLNRALLVQE